jgi:hypothetical protein
MKFGFNADEPFPIGTVFTPRGSVKQHTVMDHLTTTNKAGEVVKFRYLTRYQLAEWEMADHDITHTTIDRALAR